jgi:protein O-GlcNAc transferase
VRTTRLISATRLSEADFWAQSLLGKSLRQMPEELRPELRVTFDNEGSDAEGLSTVYNRALHNCPAERHLLFVHDDVFLHDPFLQWRIAEGLARFDVLGLAGSRGTDGEMPSWALAFDAHFNCTGWHRPPVQFSGAVSHAPADAIELGSTRAPPVEISQYGNLPAECDLLDGLFLACNTEALRAHDVRFDPQFRFHCYDVDFCRSARQVGLRLGTWPILVTHGSAGSFGAPTWKEAARRYLEKWHRIDALHGSAPKSNPAGAFSPTA